jgi:hypothetical protein
MPDVGAARAMLDELLDEEELLDKTPGDAVLETMM